MEPPPSDAPEPIGFSQRRLRLAHGTSGRIPASRPAAAREPWLRTLSSPLCAGRDVAPSPPVGTAQGSRVTEPGPRGGVKHSVRTGARPPAPRPGTPRTLRQMGDPRSGPRVPVRSSRRPSPAFIIHSEPGTVRMAGQTPGFLSDVPEDQDVLPPWPALAVGTQPRERGRGRQRRASSWSSRNL